MGDSRRVVDYTELWEDSASTSVATKSTLNGKKAQNGNRRPKSSGWSQDGKPQTASSARRLRKILNMIEGEDLQKAEIELSKMGSAKNNFDIQRALVMAKTGKKTNGTLGQQEDDDEGEEEEEYDDGEFYEDENDQDEDESMEQASFDWQGGMKKAKKSNDGRQLTHAEIWDDSALVDAWNAAEEEYKLFHAQRSAHQQSVQHQNGEKRAAEQYTEENGLPKKRSALWYDSPAKGSEIAANAKAAQQKQLDDNAELEERKRQARALLARVAGDTLEEQANGQSKGKKLKGITPPSSSVSGNLAWHSACATVSKTSNAIGAVAEETAVSIVDSPETQSPTSIAFEGEEIFQNLAMAWYYAGYYQAMAANWATSRES